MIFIIVKIVSFVFVAAVFGFVGAVIGTYAYLDWLRDNESSE